MRTGRLILVAAGFAAVTLMPARAVRAQRTAKPVLHGRHWVAITGKPLAATAGAMTFGRGRQRGGRRLRHARRHVHDVGHARLGRRDPGPRLRSPLGQGHRDQRPRRRAERRDARALQRRGPALSTGVRPAGGGDPGHPGRPDHDAGRVRPAQPRGGARAGDPARRRLPDRGAALAIDRGAPGAPRGVALLEEPSSWSTPARRAEAPAAGEVFRQPDLAATLRKLVEAEQQALALGGKPARGAAGRLRPLLPGRHRRRARPRHAGAGRALHEGGPRPLVGEDRGAGRTRATRTSTSTSSRSGPRDRPSCRRSTSSRTSTSGRWATTRPRYIHTLVPGDEPRLRRPRLLLRRPGLPAGGAGRRPAVQGLRPGQRFAADPRGRQRPRRPARRPLPLPGRREPLPGSPRAAGAPCPERETGRPGPRPLGGRHAATTRPSARERPRWSPPTPRGGSCP